MAATVDPRGYQAILQVWPPAICEGFTGLPLSRPTRIVIAADDSQQPRRDAVLAGLRRSLTALGAPAHQCPGPSWNDCWATGDAGARNVLIVLTGAAAPSPDLEAAVAAWVDQGFEGFGAIQAGDNPDHVLPAALKRINALTWQSHPLELVPQIADVLLLDAEERRIFVSYAHADGAQVADRVFSVLSRARFDVFLDRFRLEPGTDFVERIEDEILDKSMVVVVETKEAAQSKWVRTEVAMAMRRGLGIAAVNLDDAPETPAIDEALRFRDGGDDALAAFLLAQHRVQLSERRESLRNSVWHALHDAGAAPSDIVQTALGFDVLRGGRRRTIGVSVRPADLRRFRLVHEDAASDEAFIVHPQPAQHRRRRDVGWLSDRSGVAEVDEGRIEDAAPSMVAP